MTLRVLSSPPVSGLDDVVWATEYGITRTTADQAAQMQAFLDAVAHRPLQATQRIGVLPPFEIRIGSPLSITPTDGHRPTAIRGWGGKGKRDAPSVILLTADAGAGTYVLSNTGVAECELEHFAIYALGPAGPVKGQPGWGTRGIQMGNSTAIRHVSVSGMLRCGISISAGDHHDIYDVDVQGNEYGFEIESGQNSQGDIVVRKFRADGCTKAGIGVAGDVALAGIVFEDGAIGNAPFGLHRYTVAGSLVGANWIAGGVAFNRIATEFIGNGVIHDEVADGAGATDVKWRGNSVDWGLFTPDREWVYNGESKAKLASWAFGGPISDVDADSLPNAGASLPGIKASSIMGVTGRNGRTMLAKIVNNGARPFQLTGSSPSGLTHTYIGSFGPNGTILLGAYMITASTIAAGELVMCDQSTAGHKLYDGTERYVGVALHASNSADTTKTCHVVQRGAGADVKVKNTSGSTMGKGLFKAHSGGGVTPATTMADGPAIGRYVNTGNLNGQLGQAELWIP